MKLYMRQEYRASRKEPFGAMLRRIYEGLGQGGVPVQYRFTFADHMVQGMVSSVARAVKKFPHLAPLVTTEPVAPILRVKGRRGQGRRRSGRRPEVWSLRNWRSSLTGCRGLCRSVWPMCVFTPTSSAKHPRR